MMARSLHKQAGMTLLEVLVATGILAVISSLAFISIDNMVRSKSLLSEHTDQLNQHNLAFFLLQNDLQFAVSSQQLNVSKPEFVGSSQSFSLLKFQDKQASSSRIDQAQSNLIQPVQRIRWYVKNKFLVRAVQASYVPQSQLNWQERNMMAVQSFSCSYRNQVGIDSSSWPNTQTDNSQLPQTTQCLIVTEDGSESTLQITPWQVLW